MSQEQLKQQIFLLPEEIVDGNDVRLGMDGDKHIERVKQLASSILENGQLDAVLVEEIETHNEVSYKLIAGQGRRDAISLINKDRMEAGEELLQVWCVIDDGKGDTYRRAIVSNFHRTEDNPMTKAKLFEEVRKRNKWPGKKGTAKVAEFFGVSPATVTQYEKFLTATSEVQNNLSSGLLSAQAALLLIDVAPEKRTKVAERAAEIATEEAAVVKKAAKEGKTSKEATGGKVREAGKVQAKHVEKAAREAGELENKPRSRGAITEFFTSLDSDVYGDDESPVRKFSKYFETWCAGKGTDKTLYQKFDALLESQAKNNKSKKKAA